MMMTKIISSRHLLRKFFSQSVQSLSYVWLFETSYSPWGFCNTRDWIYDAINHVILCHHFLLLWFRRTAKIKSVSIFAPSICLQVMGLDVMILIFWWALSQLFHSPLSLSSKGSSVLFHFLPEGWCHLHIWGYWYFPWQSWFQLMFHPARCFSWYILHIS